MIDESKLVAKQPKENRSLIYRINSGGSYTETELKQFIKEHQRLQKIFNLFLHNFEEMFDKISTENVYNDIMEADNFVYDILIKKRSKNIKQFVLNEYLDVKNKKSTKKVKK